MERSDESALPTNRPLLSAPGKAVFAGLLFYVSWGLLVPNTASAIGGLLGNDDPVEANFLPLLVVAAVPVLLVLFALRRGSVRGIRLMWAFAYTGAALVIFDALVGLMMTFGALGRTRHDVLAGEFLLMATAVLGVLFAVLLRMMWRVRWLDPRSSPAEWERKMAVGRTRRR